MYLLSVALSMGSQQLAGYQPNARTSFLGLTGFFGVGALALWGLAVVKRWPEWPDLSGVSTRAAILFGALAAGSFALAALWPVQTNQPAEGDTMAPPSS
jgi:hypothetical protein